MKKVLITGATGFIGNYVVNGLLRQSFTVIATSLNEEKAEKFSWFPEVKYIRFDLAGFDNKKDYFQFFDQPDIMIHLAWEGLPNYKSSFHTEINLPRHFSFLSNLIRNGLKDITVTGTCLEYGMQEGCLSEDMPCCPANPYAIAKDKLRKQLEELKKGFAFSLKWVRLFYMYGKGQNRNSLFSQLDKAIEERQATFNMSEGEQVRDYLPVEQVASYIVAIATQQNVGGIINCCSGNPMQLKDLVLHYLREKGVDISLNLGYYPYLDYEPMKFWGDDRKLRSLL
jgi:nucleoside-diphosphate-sugar epimerase